MNTLNPTDLDHYPGPTSKDALEWAVQFCVTNYYSHRYCKAWLLMSTYRCYRTLSLAERRHNETISDILETEPPEQQRVPLGEFADMVYTRIGKKKYVTLRNN